MIRGFLKKGWFPFGTVIITAFVTLAAAFAAAWFSGIISFAPQNGNLYQIAGMKPGKGPTQENHTTSAKGSGEATAKKGERKIAYWRAPMNPMEIYDKPGKSAMGMDLVPVYEDELSGGVNIRINPAVQQNMGIRTVKAVYGPVNRTIRAYGNVTYDESRVSRVTLKFSGWIEQLYADTTGQAIRKGDPLFSIYSPELITAQQDLIEAAKNQEQNPGVLNKKILDSVRQRFTYLGIWDADRKRIEKKKKIEYRMPIRSPQSGIITKKSVFTGDFVKSGTMVYEIADLSVIWVEAHIYEYETPWISPGLPATISLSYLPGKTFSGTISFIYPYLQPQTRDIVARIVLDNPDLALKPDMYANVEINAGKGMQGILIPDEAVIRTGEQDIVFVASGENTFSPRRVTLGVASDQGMIQVLSGIAPGEEVVVSGQFMLDSESKLKEVITKMTKPKKETRPLPPQSAKETTETDDSFFDDLE